MVEALASPDPVLRRTALGAARRSGLLDPEGLTSYFTDTDERVAGRAVALAARIGADDPAAATVADRLVPLLSGPLAEAAAFALGELEIATDEVVAPLEAMATAHDDALCRESAVAALGALGRGREAVLAALDDIATVRRRAVIALAAFEGPEVDRALAAAVEDRDWQVRQIAEDLIDPGPLDGDGELDGSGDEDPRAGL